MCAKYIFHVGDWSVGPCAAVYSARKDVAASSVPTRPVKSRQQSQERERERERERETERD